MGALANRILNTNCILLYKVGVLPNSRCFCLTEMEVDRAILISFVVADIKEAGSHNVGNKDPLLKEIFHVTMDNVEEVKKDTKTEFPKAGPKRFKPMPINNKHLNLAVKSHDIKKKKLFKTKVAVNKKNWKIYSYKCGNEEMFLGPPCSLVGKYSPCTKSDTFNCSKFTLVSRKSIFDTFWNSMTWHQRKLFVIHMIDVETPEDASSEGPARKYNRLIYNLPLNAEKVRVCQTTFANTVGIKDSRLRYWLRHKDNDSKI